MLQWVTDDLRKRGVDSPRLDAELLITEALGCTRLALYMDLDRPLQEQELRPLRALVERRRRREPMAYILKRREFFGRRFEVTPAVLIPRPDTETLVTAALEAVDQVAATRVLDLCTGSGAVGVTLAAERPQLQVDLTDLASEALAVAERNARQHQVLERTRCFQGDLVAALPEHSRYPIVVCNPPYITDEEWTKLEPDIREHEPALALLGGVDGLAFYRRLAATLAPVLAPTAVVLLEVGEGQAEAVQALFEHVGQATRIHHDLGNVARVVEVHWGQR